jgi:hypothetical protein
MDFHLHKTNRSRKLYKEWWDASRQYRIIWTCEVQGVKLPPHYFALVKIRFPNGREMWDFVGKRGSYRTSKRPKQQCEEHHRLWSRAIEAKTATALRGLFPRAPQGIPVWAAKRAPNLLERTT